MKNESLSALEQRLQYKFHDRSLLENALTHSSFANENRDRKSQSNERLEFLGDSVLGMITAEFLYRSFPGRPEGELTRMRAALVCEKSLFAVAQELELGDCLLLGHGEDITGGRGRPSILADAVEAILAAAYLDGGFSAAEGLVHRLILSGAQTEGSRRPDSQDYKTILQELVQRSPDSQLSYRLAGESGPDHDKVFRVEVSLGGRVVGEGGGRSKKRAEQAAAHAAVLKLFPDEI